GEAFARGARDPTRARPAFPPRSVRFQARTWKPARATYARICPPRLGYGRVMTPNDLQSQMIKYLTDAHSIERQALVQMKAAPGMAGHSAIAAAFEQHRTETEEHERLVDERLSALDAQPGKEKDIGRTRTG